MQFTSLNYCQVAKQILNLILSYDLLHSPEGIEALCSDLKVDCTDFRILVLAW